MFVCMRLVVCRFQRPTKTRGEMKKQIGIHFFLGNVLGRNSLFEREGRRVYLFLSLGSSLFLLGEHQLPLRCDLYALPQRLL